MDVVTILQSVSPSLAGIIVTYLLGRIVLAIIKLLAEARAERMNAETRKIELKSQTDIEIARLDAEARTKIAEADLEKAKMQSVSQKETFEDKAKLAAELDTYRTQSDAMRQATAASLEATTQAQLETVKILARLTSGQRGTDALVKGSEARLGVKLEGARDDIIAGIEDYRDFSVLYWGMLVENPPASRDRLKRAREAWDEGDMQKAQDVADEDVSSAAATEDADKEVITP